jgi:rare lipoprotein A
VRPLALLAVGALAACAQPQPRYVVGAPYQSGGAWSYPAESFSGSETGLAVALPARGGLTANGEARDAAAMEAAHRTLQLPAVVRVTNLDTGLSALVRVNDRGPPERGRVIGLSPRAATLLGVAPGRPAPVRVTIEEGMSRALAGSVTPAEPQAALAIATAPRGALEAEALAPPPGARGSAGGLAARPAAALVEAARPASVPNRLPEEVARLPVPPARLFVQTGTFTGRDAAQRQAARVGARVEATGPARRPEWRVRLGPFASVAQADSALDRALAAGLSGAFILVD